MDSGDSRRETGIAALVSRFVDAANRVDAEAFAALWAPDARWSLPGHPVAEGRDAAVALLSAVHAGSEFRLQLQVNGVIDLHDWPVAGRWWVQELARAHGGGGTRTIACYHDTYEEGPEGWWFTERRLEVLYREEEPLTGTYTPR
jgi:uncharacterized protein (TIGR02246 family)